MQTFVSWDLEVNPATFFQPLSQYAAEHSDGSQKTA